jgi:hypothetical protein
MSDRNITPEIKKALDERIAWVKAVEKDFQRRGDTAVVEAVLGLPEEHLRSFVYVLTAQYCEDRAAIGRLRDKRRAAPED